jgi:NAD(P)-dependent dehydrogenase (short-subunit alcohol dehydrogenase family)
MTPTGNISTAKSNDMASANKLAGTVTVVVGGAGLLGTTFARGIAGEGGAVIIADRDVEKGEALAHEISTGYPDTLAKFLAVDSCDTDSVRQLVQKAHSAAARIDALVNTGYPRGPQYGARLEDVTYASFCQNVSMQIGSSFLTSQQFASFFKAQGHGNIINLGSIYGIVAPRFDVYDSLPMTMPVEYAVVKSGLLHLNKYLARYFAGSGIRFNCISPGGIRDRQPQAFLDRYNRYGLSKGMLEPQDVTGAVIFLLSEDSRYINGQNIIVDDGWTV